MLKYGRPAQNGVSWETNIPSQEKEANDIKQIENVIKKDYSPKLYNTPDHSRQEDTLTMHTQDMMSSLKRSVISNSMQSHKLMEPTPAKMIKRSGQ